MTWILFVDLFGTMVFAISGVITAIEKKFDLVGTLIIGFVTAIGGGTIRDILIGRLPVGWIVDINYIYAILLGYALAYTFKEKIIKLRKGMFLFDTIGIGLFTLIGINVGLNNELSKIVCLILGVVSACFGGVIRDMLCNEIPVIFRTKEVYATACILGGTSYFILILLPIDGAYAYIAAILIIIVTRLLAVKFNIALPNIYKKIDA